MQNDTIQFPCSPVEAQSQERSWLRIMLWRFQYALRRWRNRALNAMGWPPFIEPFEHECSVIGYTISVEVNGGATILRVGPRDYSFDRLTGKMIGSGASSGCCDKKSS